MFRRLVILAISIAWMITSRSYAGIITVPPGLAPGSEYRLVFVTADTYTATSSDIGNYNNDVDIEANAVPALAALGTTWRVIGSTASVNAIENVGQDPGVPIYNLAGEFVNADASTTNPFGLFSSGGVRFEYDNPVDFDEHGVLENTYVWTGTLASGYPFVNGSVSTALGSTGYPNLGFSGCTSACWLQDTGDSPGALHSLYGISGILTVGSTPEPSALSTLGGAILLFAMRRRAGARRRQHIGNIPACSRR